MTSIFVPREPDGELRCAATPDTVKRLVKEGLAVTVEAGLGQGSHFGDEQFQHAGASIEPERSRGMANADIVVQIVVPTPDRIAQMREGSSIISFLWAFENLDIVKQLNERRISALSMDAIPRTSRAQKHDALSSQANLAGYKAVIVAAYHLHKILPMMMTAGGTIRPARFVIIGVGVAGLQAIATARRLGAIVEATDPRPETKEDAESVGAKYLQVQGVEARAGTGGYAAEQTEEYRKAQAAMLAEAFKNADAIITTALIPYKRAPITITEDHVKSMRPGSVVVDLAAERGGNCALTESGRTVLKHGVTIVGETNWPRTLSVNASEMYARNVLNIVLDAMIKESKDAAGKKFKWTYDDDIVDGAMICHAGEVHHPKVRELMGLPPLAKPEPAPDAPVKSAEPVAAAK